MTWLLVRLGAVLLAVYVGWTLLRAYALPLFLLCAAIVGWRLWRTAASLPDRSCPPAPRLSGDLRPVTSTDVVHREKY